MKHEIPKYDWVPHEVRSDRAEGFIAYILVAVCVISLPLIFFLITALHGFE
ncbi:MAG: hypothetical protein JWM03_1334 [Rhodocyclales bacterium]|nr:hypothetical protein [Rhodocyclales bacterium]MDB5888462.1 hypothetical protein [Rhodocyclales bacterium]